MSTRKKYQVFISSTFIDMRDERQAAVQAILATGHIPAGMELFAAGDEEQWEVIKRWISESDIFLLILGARYGSIDPKTGLSYTEMEYDFAVANNIPHFALTLSDEALETKRAQLQADHVTLDNQDKLAAFRAKVHKKMSRFPHDCKDIKIFIPQSIRNLEERRSLVGWIKADTVRDPIELQLKSLQSPISVRVGFGVVPHKAKRSGATGYQRISISKPASEIFQQMWPPGSITASQWQIGETLGRALLGSLDNVDIAEITDARITEESLTGLRAIFQHLGLMQYSIVTAADDKTAMYCWTITDEGRRLQDSLRLEGDT